jgi:hypothetical protein
MREIVKEFAGLFSNACMLFRLGFVDSHSASPDGRLRVQAGQT